MFFVKLTVQGTYKVPPEGVLGAAKMSTRYTCTTQTKTNRTNTKYLENSKIIVIYNRTMRGCRQGRCWEPPRCLILLGILKRKQTSENHVFFEQHENLSYRHARTQNGVPFERLKCLLAIFGPHEYVRQRGARRARLRATRTRVPDLNASREGLYGRYPTSLKLYNSPIPSACWIASILSLSALKPSLPPPASLQGCFFKDL